MAEARELTLVRRKQREGVRWMRGNRSFRAVVVGVETEVVDDG
jgi:hypothetical protein